jgi:hypothetical protein
MEPLKGFLPEGAESPLQELTITVRDKVTGNETTIVGMVKDLVILMPVTYDELHSFSPDLPVQVNVLPPEYRGIKLSGEWVVQEGQDHYYRVSIDTDFEWAETKDE